MNTALIRNPREWAESCGYFRLSKADHERLQLLIEAAHGCGIDVSDPDRRILRKLRAAARKTRR